jgi:mannitol/fructose-specific phosphotransferase system IIA component
MKISTMVICILISFSGFFSRAQSDQTINYFAAEISEQVSFVEGIAQSMEEQLNAFKENMAERSADRAEKNRLRNRTWSMRFPIAPFVSGIARLAYDHPSLLPQLFKVLNTNLVERETRIGRALRGPAESFRKLNLCYYLGGVSGFHHTDEEWNKLSETCQSTLETELTEEQVTHLRDVLFATNFHDVLKGLGDYEREDVTLAGLCHNNPISLKIFNEEQEDYYCELNLRFRGCNLLYQRLYSESAQVAFEQCSVNRPEGFSFDEEEQAEYQQIMSRYLKGLPSLRYENYGRED